MVQDLFRALKRQVGLPEPCWSVPHAGGGAEPWWFEPSLRAMIGTWIQGSWTIPLRVLAFQRPMYVIIHSNNMDIGVEDLGNPQYRQLEHRWQVLGSINDQQTATSWVDHQRVNGLAMQLRLLKHGYNWDIIGTLQWSNGLWMGYTLCWLVTLLLKRHDENSWFAYSKWWFSIAMLVGQMVHNHFELEKKT